MGFGLKTPRQYIEGIHGRLHDAANSHLTGDITTVTIVSINDEDSGQMILADTGYDKRKLANRLRRCADILDSVTPYFVRTHLDALADRNGYHNSHWTADELAIDLVLSVPALDGVHPVALEPACEAWLQKRRAA